MGPASVVKIEISSNDNTDDHTAAGTVPALRRFTHPCRGSGNDNTLSKRQARRTNTQVAA